MLLTDEEVVREFGDPHDFIGVDGHVGREWEATILGTVHLPRAIRLSFAPKVAVTLIRCHKRIVSNVQAVFEDLFNDPELDGQVKEFGGCYQPRLQRGAASLSRHTWAIAIDLNPSDNPFGGTPHMPWGIIEAFKTHGFAWGGDFKAPRTDGMHFEFADLSRLGAHGGV